VSLTVSLCDVIGHVTTRLRIFDFQQVIYWNRQKVRSFNHFGAISI